MQTIATVGAFDNTDPNQPVTGPLFGDATLNAVRTRMQSIVGSAVNSEGVGAMLRQLGVTVADGTKRGQAAGTLAVDQVALERALTDHPPAAGALFNASNGLGTQIDQAITAYTGAKGAPTASASGGHRPEEPDGTAGRAARLCRHAD